MQANAAPFGFLRNQSRYKIPYFQRAYVWDVDNWKDLLTDLLDKNSSHFLGSIILKNVPTASGKIPLWSITDGQQRLTTLSILFRACCDVLIADPETAQFKDDIEQEIKYLLFYTESKLGSLPEVKIQHSRIDVDNYKKIIKGEMASKLEEIILLDESDEEKAPSNKILRCYKYFYCELKRLHAAQEIYEFLKDDGNNILVKIDLDSNENEQAIFDTVNSAGVRLTCADIIKNVLFQKALENGNTEDNKLKTEKLYEEYWEKVFLSDENTIEYWSTEKKEGRIKKDNIEILLTSIALIKGIYDPYKHKTSELVFLYKEYINNFTDSALRDFIKEIAEYAQLYRKWFDVPEGATYYEYSRSIMRVLHLFEVMDISTMNPYILYLIKKYNITDENDLPNEFEEILHKFESLVMRYIACDVSMANFNKVCSLLVSGKTTIDDQLQEKITELDDNAVKEKMRRIKSNKNATLILFWLELKERFDDNKESTKGLAYSYTLEHIMPQKWQEYWPIDESKYSILEGEEREKAILEAEQNRENAVYEIGNMALLNGRLNSSISNYPIEKKLSGEGKKKGIKDYNALTTTKEFLKQVDKAQKWDEEEIRIRTDILTKKFIDIWSF